MVVFLIDVAGIINDFLTDLLSGIIISQLDEMLGQVDNAIDDAQAGLAIQFGGAGMGAIFTMVNNVAVNVFMPIGGAVLAFILAYELVQMLITSNNMVDVDIFAIMFKWMIKAFLGITVLIGAFNGAAAIFALGNALLNDTVGFVNMVDTDAAGAQAILAGVDWDAASIGELAVAAFMLLLLRPVFLLIMLVVTVMITVRMIEIYISLAVAPIPMATIISGHFQQTGFNYIKTLIAYALQGILIILILVAFRMLVAGWAAGLGGLGFGDLVGHILQLLAFVIFLVMGIMKSPAIAKSLVGAS